ncbi:hypothetical protein C2869_02335 [Saccharobesus litoralis]|uniref:Uncharacterized protein n=1 Tax=Saccharobesus litoralis TaxID=2172099 RepID=A0A2S0VME4_9ALTE|nr:hypothetical protein [Saccharobesus litoralis]AWB65349.1 hypothetical protein C2869_02335 [Saccharobesus litoralis]
MTQVQQFQQAFESQAYKALVEIYLQSNTDENLSQVDFLYQKYVSGGESQFDWFQKIVTKLWQVKPITSEFISFVKDVNRLGFVLTPFKDKFELDQVDVQQNNVLHYIFSVAAQTQENLPFNYIRSLALFESNQTLAVALSTLNNQLLSPLEVFLAAVKKIHALPEHEFSAFFGLIQMMEQRQQSLQAYAKVIEHIGHLYRSANRMPLREEQLVLLTAALYKVSAQQVCMDLNF